MSNFFCACKILGVLYQCLIVFLSDAEAFSVVVMIRLACKVLLCLICKRTVHAAVCRVGLDKHSNGGVLQVWVEQTVMFGLRFADGN